MKPFYVFVLAAIVSLQTVHADVKCYVCGEGKLFPEKTCEGSEKEWTKKECLSGDCQTLTREDGDKTIVTRACATGVADYGCQTKKDTDGTEFQYCRCKGNLCNGAFNARASVVGITLLAIFSSMLFN